MDWNGGEFAPLIGATFAHLLSAKRKADPDWGAASKGFCLTRIVERWRFDSQSAQVDIALPPVMDLVFKRI